MLAFVGASNLEDISDYFPLKSGWQVATGNSLFCCYLVIGMSRIFKTFDELEF